METVQEAKEPTFKFPESRLAHRYLDGLKGIEIGGSAHNQFGLQTVNIDNAPETVYKKEERSLCGTQLRIDMISEGDELPLATSSVDFVLTSHVLEHFLDPIKALKEWYRVVKNGGYILAVVPHKERTFDKDRLRTPLAELIARHKANLPRPAENKHFSVWIAEDIVELISWLGWRLLEVQDPDDKVGNGFTIVIKVQKEDTAKNPHLSVPDLEFMVDYAVGRDLIPPSILYRMMDRMALSADRLQNRQR